MFSDLQCLCVICDQISNHGAGTVTSWHWKQYLATKRKSELTALTLKHLYLKKVYLHYNKNIDIPLKNKTDIGNYLISIQLITVPNHQKIQLVPPDLVWIWSYFTQYYSDKAFFFLKQWVFSPIMHQYSFYFLPVYCKSVCILLFEAVLFCWKAESCL